MFWDNYSGTTYTDNEQETSFCSEVGDCIDYYFMYGGSADGVIAEVRALTGDVPMMPLWSYGFMQSKERYKSQEETVGVVKSIASWGFPWIVSFKTGNTGGTIIFGTLWIFRILLSVVPKI